MTLKKVIKVRRDKELREEGNFNRVTDVKRECYSTDG